MFKKAGISHNELEAEKQKKVKVDYRCRVSEWILVLGSQPAGDVNHKPSGRNYFPPGPQLPSQSVRGLLPIWLLGEQRHDRCEQFA